MKRIVSLMLIFLLFISLSICCSADTTRITLDTPIKSSLLYECFFEDEEFDEAKFAKAVESIEYLDPIEEAEISSRTDYSHIDMEVIRLGNGEGVTVSIETTPSDIAFDDFMFHYDESLLDVTAKDIINDTKNNKTLLHIVIHAKKPCRTSFEIFETYQFFDEDYDAEDGYSYTELEIVGMDASDGRVVYVAPNGEKYHYSRDCAGENSTVTTLLDALAYEYEPCRKCAS